jgi:NAD(P)H-hydrate epimerase
VNPEPILTREIAALPGRTERAHKGDVGRIVVIGGCDDDTLMLGAPALTANAALRAGAGLVQMLLPESLRSGATILAPCATARTLPVDAPGLLGAVAAFDADVVALGPGLGRSLGSAAIAGFAAGVEAALVIDADGLNRMAEGPPRSFANPDRTVLTPHRGEMARLLTAKQRTPTIDDTPAARRNAAGQLCEAYGCTVVLKGPGTIVTNGRRLYVNETGNAGMATAGTGDVLTGVIAALIGQRMDVFEAAVLGVYLHGLAGDFAAEELGRRSLTALDLIEYLPEAFGEHEMSTSE